MSGVSLSGTGGRRFDVQAGTFDRRAGLPPAAVPAIAEAVAATAAPRADGVLVEVGAGTGEIGAALATAGGMPYIGLDLSLSMLARFGARLRALPGATVRGAIVQADADRPWPVGRRARVVFVSRALHLFDLERVVTELAACAHRDGCAVVVGRVRREAGGVRDMLRRQMRSLLAARGISGKSGESAQERLAAALGSRGGRPRAPHTAATWTAQVRPAQVLAGWRDKPGLAGVSVPPEVQIEVLDGLETWASTHLGDLAMARSSVDSYEIFVVDLPGQSEAAT